MGADLFEIFKRPQRPQQYILTTPVYLPGFIVDLVALGAATLFLLFSLIVTQSWSLFILRGAVFWYFLGAIKNVLKATFKHVKPTEVPGSNGVASRRYVFVDCGPEDEYARSDGMRNWYFQ